MTRRLLFAAFCLIASSADAQPTGRSAVLATFEVAKDGDALLVPVTVGDKQCTFLVDTGATVSMVDSSLSPFLGPLAETVRAGTPNGETTVKLFSPPLLRLGKILLTMTSGVGCMPLTDFRTVLGEQIDGVLGMDVLSQYAVHLDFDKGRLAFLKNPPPQHTDPIRIPYRVPTIVVQLPGIEPMEALIDTGNVSSTTGSLPLATFSKLRKDGLFKAVGGKPRRATYATGTYEVQEGVITACSIAGVTCTNTVWDSGNTPSVSLYFLTQFNVTFDFPNSVMYLAKNKGFGHADLVDLSGLHFRRINGRTVVEVVDENTPGENAGIMAGDVIKMVGDQDASTARLFVLRNSLCRPGATIPIVLERGSQTFGRELVLRGPAVARKTKPVGAAR